MVLGFRMVGPLSRSQHQYLRVQIFAVLARYSAFQGSPAANLHKQTQKRAILPPVGVGRVPARRRCELQGRGHAGRDPRCAAALPLL